MKIFKEGEKTKGACEDCKSIVKATFKVKSVPVSHKKTLVDNVLCSVCDECDSVISIPQQSTPRVVAALKKEKGSLDTRVPHHLMDVLLGATFVINHSRYDTLIRYYIRKFNSDKKIARAILNLSEQEEVKGPKSNVISLKLDADLKTDFYKVSKTLKANPSKIVRGIISKINKDINEKQRPEIIEELMVIGSIV